MPKFWNFKNLNNSKDVAELQLYGPVSEYSWWGDEVTPKQFSEDLKSMGDVKEIRVRINSGGGDVFAGQTIYAMLKAHSAKVVVYIDGLAASIASIIAMAADELVMHAGSMIMIHNPWSGSYGEASDFRHMADVLDKIRDSLVAVYRTKTNASEDQIKTWMNEETWFTAAEAKQHGFADTVLADIKVAASIKGKQLFMAGRSFDLAQYTKTPNLEGQEVLDMTLEEKQALLRAQKEEEEKEEEKKDMTEEEEKEDSKNEEDEEEKKDMSEEEEEKENSYEEEEEKKDMTEEDEEEKKDMTEEEDEEKKDMTEEDEPENKSAKKVKNSVEMPAEFKAMLNAADARAKKAEKEALTLRNEKELGIYVAKVKAFDNLAMNAEEFGPVFMNFARADAKGFKKLEAVLTAANNAVEQGALFSNAGTTQANETGDAWTIIETRAKALVAEAKKKGQVVEYADALTEVMRADTDLYNQYVAEMQQ